MQPASANLCKQCYNVRRLKQSEREVTASKWRGMVEQTAFRGPRQHSAKGNSCAKCGHVSLSKKARAISVLADVENETQNGTDGDWQQETSYNEEVELVWHSSDLHFEGILMRRADDAGKSGDWEHCLEVFLGNGKAHRMDKCEGERMLQ